MRKFILLILVVLLFENCNQNKHVENNQKSELIGKWIYENRRISDSEYYFFSDSTWKFKMTMADGKVRITKGKYYLGDDNEVFLRCFGSQHWRSNADTIIDYKTSIGVRVMFLENEKLINNQEDYENTYIRIE